MKSIILNKRIKWKRRLFLFTFCRRCGFARDAEVISQPALLMPAIIIRYYNKYCTIESCKRILTSQIASHQTLSFILILLFIIPLHPLFWMWRFYWLFWLFFPLCFTDANICDGERTVDWILLENRIVCWRIVALKCSSWFLHFVQLCARRFMCDLISSPTNLRSIHSFFLYCMCVQCSSVKGGQNEDVHSRISRPADKHEVFHNWNQKKRTAMKVVLFSFLSLCRPFLIFAPHAV